MDINKILGKSASSLACYGFETKDMYCFLITIEVNVVLFFFFILSN
jgi:hypothetical protein